MLDSTPVHLAYSRPFMQVAEMETKHVDVSADSRGSHNVHSGIADDMQVSFKMDISHLLLLNLFLNTMSMVVLISMVRR